MPLPKNYHVGVKALIVNGGKVLVLRDKNRYDGIDLPGGRIDEGETAQQALQRELFEELGISKFKVTELVHVYERFDYGYKDKALMLIAFKVETDASNIQISHEHTGFEWWSKDDVKNSTEKNFRTSDIKKALAKVLK